MKSWGLGWGWTRYAERLERKVSRCMAGELRVLLWKHSFEEGVGEMGKARTGLIAFTASFPYNSFPKGINPVN